MKRSDFCEIKPEHMEIAKKLIRLNGACLSIECGECPFDIWNSTNGCHCTESGYSDASTSPIFYDAVLIQSCRDFLKLKEE